MVTKSRYMPQNSKICPSGPFQQRRSKFRHSVALRIIIVDLLLTTVLRHVLLSTWQKMFPSFKNIHKSKHSMNSEHDSSPLPSSPNSMAHVRQAWKPILATKQSLLSGFNTASSKNARSFICVRNNQKPSPPHNSTGQYMIKKLSLLWTTSRNGGTG